ncbi:MAG: L,D-transpeptidase family protein [Paraprevotella sp.]|nr:L,D-transpeptidase family protein [Paraprevotella sp.]
MKKWIYILFPIVLLNIAGCNEGTDWDNFPLAQEALESWDALSDILLQARVRRQIDALQHKDSFHLYADDYAARFYTDRQPLLWTDRNGTDERSDSLLDYLETASTACGLPPYFFPIEQLKTRLEELHNPDTDNTARIRHMAFIEYELTRSFLRIACGQRYGFLNPKQIFNRLEKQDTTKNAPYRQLFDFAIETASDSFVTVAIQAARQGEAVAFLKQATPTDSIYYRFQKELAACPDTSPHYRSLSANMERCRWRYKRPTGKYVWVNVAAYELRAVDQEDNQTLSMKACVGNTKHKTPLLHSYIRYAELNPYWVVPYNIVKEEIAPLHAGKADYFIRNRMKIIERGTKKEMNPENMTKAMYLSGQYTVRQEKGEGNSLGRLIFRFPNSFSVFLHDTNNKRAFLNRRRAVSHGCVRVEEPLKLAAFLMKKPDELDIDKIRLAIDLPPLSPQGKEWAESEKYKPIATYKYQPEIPVFLDYYTVYPDTDGTLRYYDDPYGYDSVIQKKLGWF